MVINPQSIRSLEPVEWLATNRSHGQLLIPSHSFSYLLIPSHTFSMPSRTCGVGGEPIGHHPTIEAESGLQVSVERRVARTGLHAVNLVVGAPDCGAERNGGQAVVSAGTGTGGRRSIGQGGRR